MKTEKEIFDEGFNASNEELNPYLEESWAYNVWESGYDSNHRRNLKDYKKEFANKLVSYKSHFNTLCNAIRDYKEALNSFNDSLKCYGAIPPFVISFDGDLDNGWLVQPFNRKLKIELDVHDIKPLKDTVIDEPFENY